MNDNIVCIKRHISLNIKSIRYDVIIFRERSINQFFSYCNVQYKIIKFAIIANIVSYYKHFNLRFMHAEEPLIAI